MPVVLRREEEAAIRAHDLMSRTHRFVLDKLLKEPVTTSESTALANLAFLSTLPVLRDIPIDIFKSLPRDDSRRLLILAACSYAGGLP